MARAAEHRTDLERARGEAAEHRRRDAVARVTAARTRIEEPQRRQRSVELVLGDGRDPRPRQPWGRPRQAHHRPVHRRPRHRRRRRLLPRSGRPTPPDRRSDSAPGAARHCVGAPGWSCRRRRRRSPARRHRGPRRTRPGGARSGSRTRRDLQCRGVRDLALVACVVVRRDRERHRRVGGKGPDGERLRAERAVAPPPWGVPLPLAPPGTAHATDTDCRPDGSLAPTVTIDVVFVRHAPPDVKINAGCAVTAPIAGPLVSAAGGGAAATGSSS